MKSLVEVRSIRCRIAEVPTTTPDGTLRQVVRLRTQVRTADDELKMKISEIEATAADELKMKISEIEATAAELEAAAKEATASGMINSGATLRNRAAGLRRAVQILTQ